VILSRREFIDYFNREHPGLGDADSALWEPERYEPHAVPSEWFVYADTPEISGWNWDKAVYWSWVRNHCRGQVFCYSLSGGQGWFGFQYRDDIVIWSLRWTA